MSRPSKILVVSHAWYGDMIGGAFRLASEFAQHLATRGHDVSFLCCQVSGSTTEMTSLDTTGVQIHRYESPQSKWPSLLKLRRHVSRSRTLVCRLNGRCRFKHISMHSPLQAFGALRALRNYDVHTNYTVHSPFDDEINGGGRITLTRIAPTLMARRIEKYNCFHSNHVQCDSQYTLSVLRTKYGDPIEQRGFVKPGWVNTREFSPATDYEKARAALPDAWQTNLPVFFTLRRLESRMGLETLVEASRILKQRGVGFRTLIGGGGSLRESLLKLISSGGLTNEVILLGRIPENQLSKVYSAASCFILPTRALECFGLIVLEAFACNTPVIASNVAAIPELAERQGREWMFEPGDAKQLADRMQAFAERRLQPKVNLRNIALEYDKVQILMEWEQALLEPTSVKLSCASNEIGL